MANNYFQGTVSPGLYLTDFHHLVHALTAYYMDPVYEFVDEEPVIRDINTLKILMNEYGVPASELPRVLDALRQMPSLPDDHVYCNITKGDTAGNHPAYLSFPEGASNADFEFLNWLRKDLGVPYIYAQFASYCDKLREDEFGGNAWFFSENGTDELSTGSWLQQKIAETEKKD
jgi:hypothetical protein